MKLKENRGFSFFVIAVVYVMAAAVGIVVYRLLDLDLWLKILIADVAATVFVYIFSLIFGNASVYDPYWSVQPIVIVGALAVEFGLNASGIIIFTVICLWGIRLTANWAYTFPSLKGQDWRYTMLREKTGKAYQPVNFLGIHLFPTLVVYAVVMPAVAIVALAPDLNVGVIIGAAISTCAFTLQGTADYQMHKFRKSKVGGFNRNGLWKYSRHPNYLGEICMWWGVGIATVSVLPRLWYLLAGALINTLMFLFVSIPMADRRQSKKAGFDEYKAATRMLLPIKKAYEPVGEQEAKIS